MNYGSNDFAKYIIEIIRENSCEFPFPCMYQSQIKRINLDFSLDSLQKIDDLLFSMRKQLNAMDYYEIINTEQGKTFLKVVAIYALTTIAELGGYFIEWFNYEEFKVITPAREQSACCIENSYVCKINGITTQPLKTIIDILFTNPIPSGFVHYANELFEEDKVIYIDSEFMDGAQKVINAFFWDDIEAANKNFEYFKSHIERILNKNQAKAIDLYDLTMIFRKTCDFDRVHYKDSEDTPFLLRKYLQRLGVDLKDTEHKGFKSSGDLDSDLWNIGAILSYYKIDLWCMIDDEFSQLVIARQEDSDLLDDWCEELEMDEFFDRVGMRHR